MAGLGSLSAGIRPIMSTRREAVYLTELGADDRPIIPSNGEFLTATGSASRRLQYFPESLSDTKAVNYQVKDIPGGSLPLYQWINSGAREIALTATFTTDTDHYASVGTTADAAVRESAERTRAAGVSDRNIWIPAALGWLRRFMLPRYGDTTEVGVPLTFPPRKLLLTIPGSNIHMNGGDGGFSGGGGLLVVMTQCEITYEAFFPSGNPRIANCQLTFAEVGQSGGRVKFPSVTEALDSRTRENYTLGYPAANRGTGAR